MEYTERILSRTTALDWKWRTLYALLGLWILFTLVSTPRLFASQFVGGLLYSMTLVLIALGLSIILGLMGFVNFAHGAFFLLGGYLTFTVVSSMGLPFFLALLVVPLVVAAFGAVIEMTLIRQLYDREPITGLLLTYGLTLMITEAIRFQYGASPLSFQIPGFLETPIPLGITTVPAFQVFTVLVSTAAILGTYALMRYTEFGLTIRAGVQDADMTEMAGTNLNVRYTVMFFLGIYLAALGGILRTAVTGMDLALGDSFLILAFIVVVVGGMGSLFGSVVGGILVGISTYLLPTMLGVLADAVNQPWIDIAGFQFLVPYLILIVVLLSRPRGLFGEEGFME